MLIGDDILREITAFEDASADTRVLVYNRVTAALRSMIRDVADDPVLGVQLVEADRVRPNDYNPNRVASVELDLLRQSIRADGITMPVVTVYDPETETWPVVDGFHRQKIAKEDGRRWIPCSVIDKPIGDRMASTVRHNRARGKHVVDLMGGLVVRLAGEGWSDDRIAEHLGMSVEEMLRLRQMVGAAHALAADEYTRSSEAVASSAGAGENDDLAGK